MKVVPFKKRNLYVKAIKAGRKSMVQYATNVGKGLKDASRSAKKQKVETVAQVRPSIRVSSHSGGKLKTSRFRKTKRMKSAMKGVELTSERAGELSTNSQVQWIGHTSGSAGDLHVVLWRSIIKRLFQKVGINIRAFTDDVKSSVYQLTENDFVQVQIQTSDGTISTVTATVPAGGWTFDNFTSTFAADANLRNQQTIMKWIAFTGTENNVAGSGMSPPNARLDLEHMYCKVFMKSNLKIQNRTAGASGANSENIDNVPLFGRTYGGKGTGAVQIHPLGTTVQTQVIADRNTGIIQGNANDIGMGEPIHQMYFQYVTQKGKIHLDPGFIKTSTLYHAENFSLNRLHQILTQILIGAKQRNPFGKFRFFGIERMIDTSLVASPVPVTLGVECNSYINVSLYSRFPNITTPGFQRTNI